jgi:hypothetical protein
VSELAHRPAPLHRSIRFWVLVGGSAATAATGAFLLVDKLAGMSTVLLDGSATGVDVYVGQVWAILGAILVGAGALGLGLALTLGVLRGLLTRETVETVAPEDDLQENDLQENDAFGYDRDLGYEDAERVEAADDEPVATR